jgi:hypothetical protein
MEVPLQEEDTAAIAAAEEAAEEEETEEGVEVARLRLYDCLLCA